MIYIMWVTSCVAFFMCGFLLNKCKKMTVPKKQNKDDDLEKSKKIKKAFDELMSYDYDRALKGGVNRE